MSNEEYFGVETRWSGSEHNPSRQRMREILDELETQDPEHPDTWLTHSSGWTLTADEDGNLTMSRVGEDDAVGHLANVPIERMLELWVALSEGNVDPLLKEPWRPGRPVMDPAKVAAIAAAVAEARAEEDRSFYEVLGDESTTERCKVEGCTRGRISASWWCRIHHFEGIRGRPCPFNH